MRRAILRLRRFNWRWTLAFTRKPPGGEWLRGVKYLNYPPNPGGFRASWPRSDSHYAWLRSSTRRQKSPSGPGRWPRLYRVEPADGLGHCQVEVVDERQ